MLGDEKFLPHWPNVVITLAEKGLLEYTRTEPGHEAEPVGIVTGAAQPPAIVTGRDEPPDIPEPGARRPNLPPRPALRTPPEVREGALTEEPPASKNE